ncbi:MAG: hypothetical protein HY244_01110 [Rhizobiales bacterium]|nr:hypothetical protein [Hyphomicrobiales bacterium]
MRHPIALLVLTGALALNGAALARDITLPPTAAEALKSACDKAGGQFSQDAKGYGCGTNCLGKPGTDCIVHCATGEKCSAQVIGARHPRSIAEALTKPAQRSR